MAIVDSQGAAVTTGAIICVATKKRNTAVLVTGTIVDAIQVDNGERYFHVVDSDPNGRHFTKAIITGGVDATSGTLVNAVKIG